MTTISPHDENRSTQDIEDKDRVAFHMAEFATLKSEIAELVKQTGSYMTFAVTASGGIAAWLLTHAMEPNVDKFARWLPFLTSTLFGCFALAPYLRIGEKGRYLRRIEDKLAFDDLGWEKTFAHRMPAIGVFQFIGWAVLNASAVFVAIANPFPVQVRPALHPAFRVSVFEMQSPSDPLKRDTRARLSIPNNGRLSPGHAA